jgi:hypothetical protein
MRLSKVSLGLLVLAGGLLACAVAGMAAFVVTRPANATASISVHPSSSLRRAVQERQATAPPSGSRAVVAAAVRELGVNVTSKELYRAMGPVSMTPLTDPLDQQTRLVVQWVRLCKDGIVTVTWEEADEGDSVNVLTVQEE